MFKNFMILLLSSVPLLPYPAADRPIDKPTKGYEPVKLEYNKITLADRMNLYERTHADLTAFQCLAEQYSFTDKKGRHHTYIDTHCDGTLDMYFCLGKGVDFRLLITDKRPESLPGEFRSQFNTFFSFGAQEVEILDKTFRLLYDYQRRKGPEKEP